MKIIMFCTNCTQFLSVSDLSVLKIRPESEDLGMASMGVEDSCYNAPAPLQGHLLAWVHTAGAIRKE
jgi:hypothetical protein